MKQNEKILVYAVTGFLVVILMIAVVFGKDGARQTEQVAGQPAVVRNLDDLLRERAGIGSAPALETLPGQPAGQPVDPVQGGAQDEAEDPTPVLLPAPAGRDPLGVSSPLAVSVPLQPPTPEALVTEKLGLSRREGEFRIVRARAGDSLGSLVQKWCGSTQENLDIARSLNEELSVLRIGQEVVLPWVEDEVVLAAYEERSAGRVRAATATTADAARVLEAASRPFLVEEPAGAATNARRYKIRSGDSLWKLAEKAVGRKGAPAWLAEVRELNPDLNIDRLKVGEVVLLPAN